MSIKQGYRSFIKYLFFIFIYIFSQNTYSSALSDLMNSVDDSHVYAVLEWETSKYDRVDLDLKLKSPNDKEVLDWSYRSRKWGDFIYDKMGYTESTSKIKVSEMLALDIYDTLLFERGVYKFYATRYSGGSGIVKAQIRFYVDGKEITNVRRTLQISSTKKDEFTGVSFNNKGLSQNTVSLTETSDDEYNVDIIENRSGESSFAAGRGARTYFINNRTYGYGDIITTIKEIAIKDRKKISTLSIMLHGTNRNVNLRKEHLATGSIPQYFTFSKNMVHPAGVHSGREIINLYHPPYDGSDFVASWTAETVYARSRLKSLGKYLSRKNGRLPHILLWSCNIGKNEDLLKAIAKESNAIVHANSQYTGDEGVIAPEISDWKLDIVAWPDGTIERK